MKHLIVVTSNDGRKIIYRCAVYGNNIDKVLIEIANKLGGILFFDLEGYWFKEDGTNNEYRVSVESLDDIFLS